MRYRDEFNLLWSDYSRGRAIGEIRSDFVNLLSRWDLTYAPDIAGRVLEVAVWCGAFGLAESLVAWRDRFDGTSRFTRWVLGEDDALATEPAQDEPAVEAALVLPALMCRSDPTSCGSRLEEFVTERWYDMGVGNWWHDRHKDQRCRTYGLYFGYWCWEAAAVALLTPVDDSAMARVPYYPYDLVHYAQAGS